MTLCINHRHHEFPNQTYLGNLCRAMAEKLIMNFIIMTIYPENLDGRLDPHLDLLILIFIYSRPVRHNEAIQKLIKYPRWRHIGKRASLAPYWDARPSTRQRGYLAPRRHVPSLAGTYVTHARAGGCGAS